MKGNHKVDHGLELLTRSWIMNV